MSWTPLFEVDSGSKSESEQAKEKAEIEFRSAILVSLSGINRSLQLLNARFEEAHETHIESNDI